MDPRLEAAAALEAELRELIALLESPSSTPQALAANGERCASRVAALRALDGAGAPRSEASRAACERALRLGAVAASLVDLERDALVRRIEVARRARAGLGFYGSADDGAGSGCDRSA